MSPIQKQIRRWCPLVDTVFFAYVAIGGCYVLEAIAEGSEPRRDTIDVPKDEDSGDRRSALFMTLGGLYALLAYHHVRTRTAPGSGNSSRNSTESDTEVGQPP